MPVYKSEKDNPKKELEFEIDYQLGLTTADRFKMMFKKSREIAEILQKNGHRKPFKIIKRK